MSWPSVSAFFAMGGYAPFVWGAYAVFAAGLLVEPLLARRRHRAALEAIGGGADSLRMDRP